MPISFTIGEDQYSGEYNEISSKEFYERMRQGQTGQTTQINPSIAGQVFKKYLSEGRDILHIGFSSALSGSFNSACLAAKDLKEEFPEREIALVDSLCASMGEALLVDKAVKLRAEGKSLKETAEIIESIKLNLCHYFTVDDLIYLHRGGRVSKTTAVVGSLLGIKPVLRVDNDGRLVPHDKVRGRKASLLALVENMERLSKGVKNDTVFLSHGDCLDDAKFVAQEIKSRFGITDILIGDIGPAVGSHSGPGTIALFFMGNER